MKFLCIGDISTVTGLRFAGVEGVVVNDPAAAQAALDQALASGDVGVVIIPDQVGQWLGPQIHEARFTRTQPAIVEIPGPDGPRPGRRNLIDLIREAIGVQL
jgi:V/A-type H+-transporting ATPase subunit F